MSLELFPFSEADQNILQMELKQGSFVLLQVPDNLSDVTAIKLFGSKLKALKKLKVHPILTSNVEAKSKEWLNNKIISASIDISGKLFILNETPQIDPLYADSIFTGFFSSGSTGNQKLIIHRDSSLWIALTESEEILQLNNESNLLSSLPLFHMGGYLNFLRKFQMGQNVTFVNPKNLYSTWSKEKPSHLVGVPAQLIKGMSKNCPKTHFYCGGAKLEDSVWQQAIDKYSYLVTSSYGLTESAGAIIYRTTPSSPLSVFPSTTIELSSHGHTKLLAFKSTRMAVSIHSSSGEKRNLQKNDLYETQDTISLSKGDQKLETLKITGRRDQTIICGGENIDPLEIRKTIEQNYEFEALYIHGMNNKLLGQIPVVFADPLPTFNSESSRDNWLNKFSALFPSIARPRVIMSIPEAKGIKPSYLEFMNHYNNRSKEDSYEL